MSSIFGKDKQFMSDMDLEVASFVDLPLKPGDNSPESFRPYTAELDIPNNLPINRITEKPHSLVPPGSMNNQGPKHPGGSNDIFQDNLKQLIDITPQHTRPNSFLAKTPTNTNGPIPYTTPSIPAHVPAQIPMQTSQFDDSDQGQLFDNIEDALG